MMTRRALAALLLMLAGALAFAQNENQEAKELAQRLGRERSVEGLETIASSRNRELLEWYERGYRETWAKDLRAPHPPGIEKPLRAWLAEAKPGSGEARTLEGFLALLAAPPPPPPTAQERAQAKRAEIENRIREAERFRNTDSKRYIDAMSAALKDAPAEQGLAMAWLQLGNFTRFTARDARRALEFYASAERDGLVGFASFAQGDTWQFDLRDKAKAIASYRRNLESLRQASQGQPGDKSFFEFAERWLTHQVAYLESGRTFSGEIGRDDIAGAGVMTMFGAGRGGSDEEGFFPSGALGEMPPSTWSLIRASAKLGSLPDGKSVLAFLARHDPAGYASACYFGLVELSERNTPAGQAGNPMFAGSQAVRDAKARFLRERKISLQPLPLRP